MLHPLDRHVAGTMRSDRSCSEWSRGGPARTAGTGGTGGPANTSRGWTTDGGPWSRRDAISHHRCWQPGRGRSGRAADPRGSGVEPGARLRAQPSVPPGTRTVDSSSDQRLSPAAIDVERRRAEEAGMEPMKAPDLGRSDVSDLWTLASNSGSEKGSQRRDPSVGDSRDIDTASYRRTAFWPEPPRERGRVGQDIRGPSEAKTNVSGALSRTFLTCSSTASYPWTVPSGSVKTMSSA